MERIVYVLGAGFSAPLGLPLVSNFLIRSKDIYFNDYEGHKSFEKVFKTIEAMHVAKSYYVTDLFNIEEIFSILQMREQLKGTAEEVPIAEYIRKVITSFTPEFLPYVGSWPSNWYDVMFGEGLQALFISFVASLRNLQFFIGENEPGTISRQRAASPAVKYSVITLNYDLVIERCNEFINRFDFRFAPAMEPFLPNSSTSDEALPIAKLHGSVDAQNIVPPTWAKAVNKNIENDWRLAFRLLTDATQIRFLGYSLPVADSYLKYLLKAASLDVKHLKAIDVICKDPDGTVKERYDSIINFNFYRFRAGDVGSYMADIYNRKERRQKPGGSTSAVVFNQLENAHTNFMNSR